MISHLSDVKHRLNTVRTGVTSVELIIVLGILITISLIATPTVIESNRRAAVNAAGETLERSWGEARQLALQSTANLTASQQDYYGIVIYTDGANSPSGNPLVRVVKHDGAGTPEVLNEYELSANNTVLVTPQGGSGSSRIELYAQHNTGLPIDASNIASNNGMYALPISLGTTASPLCERLYLHTIDYDVTDTTTPADERPGYARQFQIYEVSIACVTDVF